MLVFIGRHYCICIQNSPLIISRQAGLARTTETMLCSISVSLKQSRGRHAKKLVGEDNILVGFAYGDPRNLAGDVWSNATHERREASE